jgi:hypothetical protein
MNSRIYSTVYLLFLSTTLIFSQTNKLAFIQNKGQWPLEINYLTDFPGGQALATSTGMLVGCYDPASIQARVAWGMKIEARDSGYQYQIDHPTPPDLKGHGWRFHFLNGNPMKIIENKGQSNDFYNFWIGDPSHHASKVRSFDEITYKNVYDNIDVKYYTSAEGFLENDIILNPSADATNMSFEIEGIDIITLNNQGGLVLTTTVGDVTVPAPISYLIDDKGRRTPVQVRFILDNKVIRFSIPSYDHSQTLIIDPVIVRWATWATNASSADTHNHGTGVDSLGNLYVTGRISTNGLITVGAFQSTSGGGYDIFVGKYVEPAIPGGSGSRVWQTYLGGSGLDNSIGLQMGIDGFIYLTANTTSDMAKTYGSGFSAGSWTQRTSGGGALQQMLVVKLDMAGNGALTREMGSLTNNFAMQASDIRVVKTGIRTYDLIYSGYCLQPASLGTADGDFPTPQTPSGTTYTQPSSAKLNGLILRISSDFNTLSWIKNIGSDVASAKDEVICITTVDLSGNIYAAGYTVGTANISYNNPSTQTAKTGTQDGWIMKLNGSGVVQWSRYFNSGVLKTTSILSMELNQADTNLTIAGITSGLAATNITSGVVQSTYGGGTMDLFVAKISKSGSMTNWGTYFGGSGTETNMMGLNTDVNDDIYFLGYSSSTNYLTTANPIQSTNFGLNDAVFTKLNSTGTAVVYSTYYGGNNDDNDPIGQRGILFNNCRAYLSVTANSPNIPLTLGALTTTKTSGTSVPEPVIVSMANPPDLLGNSISTPQLIPCHMAPTMLSAGIASYNIPGVIRSGILQTNGTVGAYPSGLPGPTGYQWQQSIDYTHVWTNIAGATSQNYSPGILVQTTYYRRVVSGDFCIAPDSIVAIAITGGPNVSPMATCAGTTLSLFSNATGGSGSNTYDWTGPLSFTSTLQNPQITPATNANDGYYTVTATDAGGCKNTKAMYVDFSACTFSVVLSVTLLNFDAIKNETTTSLKWQTGNELNSDNFNIERSNNGMEWHTIGNVKAAGSSLKLLSYNFIDKYPEQGINFYRLKCNESYGKFGYSTVKKVIFDDMREINIISVMPNPFENTVTVNYVSPDFNTTTLRIIDAIGRTIETKECNTVKGLNTIQWNTMEYAKGMYFITLIYDDKSVKYKMVMKN